MLKTADNLTSYNMVAGEPFLLSVQVRHADTSAVIAMSARPLVLAFYAAGGRETVQVLVGAYSGDAGGLHRFARDGSLSEQLFGRPLTVELSERLNSGRQRYAVGSLTIEPSARDIGSNSSGVVGRTETRITMFLNDAGAPVRWEQTQVAFTGSTSSTPAPVFTTGVSVAGDGTPQVGEQLTGIDGAVSNGSVVSRRWLSGTAVLSTNQTYTPTGTGTLTYEATADGPGGSGVKSTANVTVAAATVQTPAPTITTPAGINSDGTPQVGELLTGIDPVVTNGTVTLRQWLLNSTVLASTATYTPTGTGSHQFRATVTGTDGSTLASSSTVSVAAAAVAPTLAALTVSPGSATVGTAYMGAISGRTTGSTLWLSGTGSAGLSISGTTIIGTPTIAGAIDVIETLAGAIGSPRTSSGLITVAAAPPVLATLAVSPNSATVGTAYSGAITGKTSGSALTLTGAGAAGLTVTGSTISGTPTTQGTVNSVETLAGATGSPRTTTSIVTVGILGPVVAGYDAYFSPFSEANVDPDGYVINGTTPAYARPISAWPSTGSSASWEAFTQDGLIWVRSLPGGIATQRTTVPAHIRNVGMSPDQASVFFEQYIGFLGGWKEMHIKIAGSSIAYLRTSSKDLSCWGDSIFNGTGAEEGGTLTATVPNSPMYMNVLGGSPMALWMDPDIRAAGIDVAAQGYSGNTSTQIADYFVALPDDDPRLARSVFVCFGRNDSDPLVPPIQLQRIKDKMKPYYKRLFVLASPYRRGANRIGDPRRAEFDGMNAALKAIVGNDYYADGTARMIDSGPNGVLATAIARGDKANGAVLTAPSSQDIQDFADGVPPLSLMYAGDGADVHPADAGHKGNADTMKAQLIVAGGYIS